MKHQKSSSAGVDTSSALVIIDMQEVFAAPDSQWHVPEYWAAEASIARLNRHFADSNTVIWTRFVRDPDEHGSWRDYYDRWTECRLPQDASAWNLTVAIEPHDPVVSLPTFSKWGNELEALTATSDRMIVCGVSTDCCVLSTVLGAVDAGRPVTVVADACAGLTREAHEQTLAVLGLLAPMVQITETDQLLGRV